ncbi:uncharacterized protein [Elaeis guineensis]|uniref:uncharacterized protein n=1 Tax=Elaeis guineensis var. tenera TaxID=51953 RepID=UPI003C6D2391
MPWQLSLAEPPVICRQQRYLAITFPESQPFEPTACQSDALVSSLVLDDTIECNMCRFPWLGLPSGCSSQSLHESILSCCVLLHAIGISAFYQDIRNHWVGNFANLEHLCAKDCFVLDSLTYQ